jgi:hypothetical protein
MPKESGEPDKYWLTATVNAMVRDNGKVIAGDRITYESTKELFWEYGERGRQVTIVQQAGPGQQFSTTTGMAFMTNRKTGRSELIDPGSFAVIDPKSPARFGPWGPEPDKKDDKKPRQEPRISPRADKDRQGFRGR